MGGNDEPRTIMVVDDDKDVLESTEMMLNLLGYDVVALPDPTQAVEVAARTKPLLILQDLRMERLDLPRLCRRLRENPTTRTIPIVFFSAMPELETIAAQLDADGILAKPFSGHDLKTLLARAIPAVPPLERSPKPLDIAFQSEMDELFHHYWNVFTAVSSNAEVLAGSPGLGPEQRAIVDQIERILLKTEREAHALRTWLRNVVAERAAIVPHNR